MGRTGMARPDVRRDILVSGGATVMTSRDRQARSREDDPSVMTDLLTLGLHPVRLSRSKGARLA